MAFSGRPYLQWVWIMWRTDPAELNTDKNIKLNTDDNKIKCEMFEKQEISMRYQKFIICLDMLMINLKIKNNKNKPRS